MNPAARKILRTYAEGMGIPYSEVAATFAKASQVEKFRALHMMRKLEEAWQEEMQIRAQPKGWRRLWMRVTETLRRWREPSL